MSKNLTIAQVRTGAVITGCINGLMNGTINWFTSDKTQGKIALTQDSISSNQHTVFSGAVSTAVSLAFVLSTIAYFAAKVENKPPYFPKFFVKAVKHCIYAFGLVVIFSILFHRVAGSIEVGFGMAAVITGVIAGIVGAIVNYETNKELVK